MYTRCPHCTTIFQVTAEQLRLAHGDVSCVTCTQSFHAVDSLADDVPTLIAAAADPETESDELPDGADTVVDPDREDDDEPGLTDDETAREEALEANDKEGDVEPDAAPDDADSEDDGDDDTRDQPRPDLSDNEPEGFDEFEDAESIVAEQTGNGGDEADVDQADESLEFNAPEQTWAKYFLTDGEAAGPDEKARESAAQSASDSETGDNDDESLDNQTGDQSEWRIFLAELNGGLADEAAKIWLPSPEDETDRTGHDPSLYKDPFETGDDADEMDAEEAPADLPPWLADESPDEAPRQERTPLPSWRALGIFAALAALIAGQLIHYNRDALAAHEAYGGMVRGIYAALDSALYPDWPLDAFEVTGTEAIAGRSNQNGLDVLANVIVTGRQPVGLPLIRIVLRDRWSNAVASRVFEPREYLHDFEPAGTPVSPGTALPIEVSVADPGVAATGYFVDVCLPRRKTGLECQIARDPFQR